MSQDETTLITTEIGSFSYPQGFVHKFYLSGQIGPPDKYTHWFETIRNASPNDTIVIYINSPGGQGDTAIQFRKALSETSALTVGSVEGRCASAATFIFLACHKHIVADHSAFLFHNYSAGFFGKGNSIHTKSEFDKRWVSNLYTDIYGGFLTPEEIASVLDDKDLWLSSSEVVARLEARKEDLKEKVMSTPAGKLARAITAPRKNRKTRP